MTERDISEAETIDLITHFEQWKYPRLLDAYNMSDFDDMAISIIEIDSTIRRTYDVLAACNDVGIDLISIGVKTPFIKRTLTWPVDFGYRNSMFTREVQYRDKEAVWHLPDMVEGITSSCGNACQRQFDGKLVSGVYLKKNETWYYVINYDEIYHGDKPNEKLQKEALL